jgi:DNA mismatch repair protein MutL
MFARTPARLKFMKSNASETAYVASVMEKMAISHPEVAIKFIADGKLRFSTNGDGNLKNAIYSVFGRDFASKLIEVNGSADGIKVTGYVGRSDNVRKNRNLGNIFNICNGICVNHLNAITFINGLCSTIINQFTRIDFIISSKFADINYNIRKYFCIFVWMIGN